MTDANTKESRTLSGVVVSDKMIDTIVVLVERSVKHPKYNKIIKRSSKIHAHDPDNSAKIGDKVVITETRPISKTKSWKLMAIRDKVK